MAKKTKLHNLFSNWFHRPVNALWARPGRKYLTILSTLTVLWVILMAVGFSKNPDVKNKNDIQASAWFFFALAIVFFLFVENWEMYDRL